MVRKLWWIVAGNAKKKKKNLNRDDLAKALPKPVVVQINVLLY